MSSPRWKRSWAAGLAAAASFVVVAAAIAGRDGLVAWFLGDRAAAVGGEVVYTCPMDPSVEAHAPGKCPLCGMDLTPTSRADRNGLLTLDRDAMQRIGLRLAVAEKRTLIHHIVASGSVVAPAAAAGTASIEAIVYGDDAAGPTAGAAVGAVTPALPLTRFSGAITSSAPEPEARAARLRVALTDPGRMLRAGQPIELEIDTELIDRLVVPARAILYVGKRRLAFVDRGRGGLELRELDIGVQEGDFIEVRRGLEAGQRVVASGTFLVAAESRIRSASPLWDDGEVARPAGGKP
jgi:hypothetical protein